MANIYRDALEEKGASSSVSSKAEAVLNEILGGKNIIQAAERIVKENHPQKAFIQLSNTLEQHFSKNKNFEMSITALYRSIIEQSLTLKDTVLSHALQLLAQQAKNILFWISQHIEGADKIELTINENDMLKYPADKQGKRKYPLGSYLRFSTMPVKSTDKELPLGFSSAATKA